MYLDDPGAVIPGENRRGADLIAWHPGSGSPKKNWAPERWADTFVGLGIQELIVVTGEAEEERAAEIEEALASRELRATPARGLGFDELVDRLRSAKVFLGHDSGISHLAAACGVPCVLIFGSDRPRCMGTGQRGSFCPPRA